MSAINPRFGRSSRRRETPPPRTILLRAGLFTAVVLGLVWLSLSIYGGAPWHNYKTVYATAPDTGNLRPHQPVKVDGVQVGQVIAIGVTSAGQAKLTLQIAAGTKLPMGTSFKLRADGLLGSRYVQLLPGHGSRELPADATLHGNVTSLTYGAPDALNVFNSETRGNLGKLVDGLGGGLLGRGQGLNSDIHLVAADSVAAQQLLSTVTRAGDLQALVPALDRLTAPLDAARMPITDGLRPFAKAVEPLVSQRAATQAALSDAPATLTAGTAALTTGQRLLTAARSLAVAAENVLPSAPAGLRQATALLADSHPALARATILLSDARPAVPALLHITRAANPVLAPLADGLTLADPIINTVAPYGCNVENAAGTIRSMTGFGGNGPGGPGGVGMAFRLELVLAPPTEIVGTKDYTGLVERQGYAPPCTNLSSAYPTSTAPLSGLTASQR
jgi:phospholipid/cholesterol/gamma-HCH transport system substrate-binding protein